MKAMGVGVGACKWREIEVVRARSGQPSVALSGGAAALAERKGVTGLAAQPHPHRVDGRSGRCRTLTRSALSSAGWRVVRGAASQSSLPCWC